jgi:hypothetical protein
MPFAKRSGSGRTQVTRPHPLHKADKRELSEYEQPLKQNPRDDLVHPSSSRRGSTHHREGKGQRLRTRGLTPVGSATEP